MSTDTTLTIEERAAEMGWAPKDRWRGPDESWVDAEAFVKRGEEIMPILRHNLNRATGETLSLKKQLADEKEARENLAKQLKELVDFQTEEVARQVKEQTKDLRRQIREAREAGDTEREDELQDKLEDIRTKHVAPSPQPAPPPPPATDPSYEAWAASNSWFGDQGDPEKTGLALGVAAAIRKANPLLNGKEFYAEVDKRMATYLRPPPSPSKVEGGSEGGGPAATGGDYTALPADAKAQCAKDAARFVGSGKMWKTEKEWQAHYAKVFFAAQGPRA